MYLMSFFKESNIREHFSENIKGVKLAGHFLAKLCKLYLRLQFKYKSKEFSHQILNVFTLLLLTPH